MSSFNGDIDLVTKSHNKQKYSSKKSASHRACVKQRKSDRKKVDAIMANIKRFGRGRDTADYQSGPLDQWRHIVWRLLCTPAPLVGTEVCRVFEGVLLLYLNVKDATTITQVVTGFGLYTRDFFDKSMSEELLIYVEHVLVGTTPQAGSTETTPKWMELLRNAKDNWTTIVHCEGFRKISCLLSLAIGAGLCQASDFEFSIAGIKVFSAEVMKKHVTATSLIDALVDTVYFFIEGGYQCFKTGTLRPLLYADAEAIELEDSFFDVMDKSELSRIGDLERTHAMDDNDLSKLFEQVIDRHRVVGLTSSRLELRSVLRKRQDELLREQANFLQRRNACALREAPFTINLYGTTSVGKSTLAKLLVNTILHFNGFDCSNERIITIKETDKFLSTYKSHTNAVILDDLGNTNEKFVEKAPTDRIIEFCNNTPQYADKADLADKGKVALAPKMVLITTNDKTMGAGTYSNEPASIMRRAHYTITAKVKSQFAHTGMLDSQKVENYYLNILGMDSVPALIDVWDLTVETVDRKVNTAGQKDSVTYHVVQWHTPTGIQELRDVSIITVIQFLQDQSKKYYVSQKNFVKTANNLTANLHYCATCGRPSAACMCSTHTEKQFGAALANTVIQYGTQAVVRTINQRLRIEQRIEEASNSVVFNLLSWIERSPFARWTNWVPVYMFESPYLRRLILWSMGDDIKTCVKGYLYMVCSILLLLLFTGNYTLFFIASVLLFYAYSTVVQLVKDYILQRTIRRNGIMPLLFRTWRDQSTQRLLQASAALGAIWAAIRMWKHTRKGFEFQGSLSPENDDEVTNRNAETNPWAGYVVEPFPVSEKSKCVTSDRLQTMVRNNLCCMEFYLNNKAHYVDAFFIKSNVALVPDHIFQQPQIYAIFTKHGMDKAGGNFKCHLSESTSLRIPDTDLRLIWVPSAGDWKDLTEYYPVDHPTRSVPARLIYKQGGGDTLESGLKFEPKTVTCQNHTYLGGSYSLEFDTFPGLCMATLVADARSPFILGHHLGGYTGKTYGIAGTLTQKQLHLAFAELRKKDVLLSASAGDLPDQQYGTKFSLGNTIHEKSPVGYLSSGGSIEIYGSVIGRNSYYSEVVQTQISPVVEDVCGVSNQWAAPQFRPSWKPFQVALESSSHPSQGVEPDLLSLAKGDYTNHMIKKLRDFPKLRSEVRVLSDMEIVCGIDGMKFIDKMPPNTSVGFPLNGAKSKYLVDLDPEDFPDFSCPRELDEVFFQELAKYENLWACGKRAYPIFKGCLKDEPTKIGKDKVRVFQAAPIALQLAIRKYFLPVARILSLFPLDSECAVGINAHSLEWQEFSDHISGFGKDRIIAGDYKTYDLRMPAQVVLMAFKVMIEIACDSGYCERDIAIMEGIATEVAYPVVAYNGDLLKLVGSNPSGQNLTVYVNSIANSLFFRCAYFEFYGPKAPPFRSIAKVGTYGDDIKGSVKEGYDKFHHISVANWLARHDIILTMPDKKATPVEYMNDQDADFLKRKNIHCPKTGHTMAALDETSIFKSLHSCVKSKVLSDVEKDGQAIDGALREWFFHGEEVFNLRQTQMQVVAKKAGIEHACSDLHVTYDMRVDRWRLANGLDPLEPPSS